MKTPSMAAAVAAATLVDPSTAFSSLQKPTEALAKQPKQREDVAALQPSRRAFFDKISKSAGVAAVVGIGILPQPEPANAAIKTGAANSFTGYVLQEDVIACSSMCTLNICL